MADRQSLHINCGGDNATIKTPKGSLLYEGDKNQQDTAAMDSVQTYWGFSSTGDFMDDENNVVRVDYHVERTDNSPSGDSSHLYASARKSPQTLTYYGFCLDNGVYAVKLHFAEIVYLITDGTEYNSLARRVFDIYIQVVWIVVEVKKKKRPWQKVIVTKHKFVRD